jgi:uncharacterized repeat protein (TIGR02059 family)
MFVKTKTGMKKLLIIPILLISLISSAATYYVSSTGSDSNPGTIAQPWKSLNYAFNRLLAGDVLYMRGGTYTTLANNNDGISLKNRDGGVSSKIKVLAYNGEQPILDCSSLSSSSEHHGLLMEGCDYWDITGLTIIKVRELQGSTEPAVGCQLQSCSNVYFRNSTVRDCGNGWITYDGNEIYYINCDSYQNADFSYQYGGLANGFYAKVGNGSKVYYDGCRSWLNSDDGWDHFISTSGGDGFISYNRCWAFENGAWNGQTGNGCGFKTGRTVNAPVNNPARVLTNCIAANNLTAGYDESQDPNQSPPSMSQAHVIYNSISYNNDTGFQFEEGAGGNGFVADIIRNNISFNDKRLYWTGFGNNTVDHNSWQNGLTVTSADFVSTDASQLKRARQADGSLPEITFMHLVSSSDLINKGVNVGLPYGGSAPDLGPFETQLSTAAAIPSYLSSSVENSTPTLLEINYNITLANSVPAVTAFSVIVNSVPRPVNSVTISGSKVQLTLVSAIKYGDIITIAYVKPAGNPLKSESGGEAISFSAQSTTNNLTNSVKDTAPATISMIVSPNPVHKIINIAFKYTSSALAPQIIRIFDISGKLFIEKLLTTGVANVRFSINLNSGVYNVLLFSGGLQMASQKIIVHK